MKASDIPELVQLPWADGAGPSYINSIPTASQIGITNGLASLTDGFPPLTFQPIGAGGQPPFGADFNGILNLISANTRWNNAGTFYPYDGTFSAYIGGYPKGAVLVRADDTGFWLSTLDDNTNNPESTGTGWVPINNTGVTTISGLTNANVTLTPLQYAKNQIVLTGTLTGNIQIIFPDIAGQEWEVLNKTSGAFTITCKTSAGSGVPVSYGVNKIGGDGTNIFSLAGPISPYGIVGSSSQYTAVVTSSTAATITAAEATLSNGSSDARYVTVRSVSTSINTATVGAGGRDTATAMAANTWYHHYLIYNPSSGATSAIISTNSVSPVLPSGYTFYARMGSFRTNGSANLLGMRQRGKQVSYIVGLNNSSMPVIDSGLKGTWNTSSPTYAAASVSNFVPTGFAASIDISLDNSYGSGTGCFAAVAPNNSYSGVITTNSPPISADNNAGYAHTMGTFVLESTNIYWVSSAAQAAVYCRGWTEY